MSQENIETLRAIYGDWERGDFTTSLPLYDENVTMVIDSGVPDGGTYMRPEGVLEYMSRFLAPWESLTIAGESFRDTGDTILVNVRQNGIGRSSGVPVELWYFHLWTFGAARVVRFEVIMDEAAALEAVGLSE
jgi:ketosteroid isomerase-like protein